MTLTPTCPASLAVVTGASTGIGRALAREFAQHGFDVAGSAKNRIQAELGTHLPDALAAPLMARMTKPQD